MIILKGIVWLLSVGLFITWTMFIWLPILVLRNNSNKLISSSNVIDGFPIKINLFKYIYQKYKIVFLKYILVISPLILIIRYEAILFIGNIEPFIYYTIFTVTFSLIIKIIYTIFRYYFPLKEEVNLPKYSNFIFIIIFISIISDIYYMFNYGRSRPSDVSDGSDIIMLLLLLSNILALVLGLIKFKKHKIISTILILVSLPGPISLYYISNHRNDFYPQGVITRVRVYLSSMRAQAELYYLDNKSYMDICDSTNKGFGGIKGPGLLSEASISSSKGNVKVKCFSNINNWVVVANSTDFSDSDSNHCVDSTGLFKSITREQNDLITNADSLCPE